MRVSTVSLLFALAVPALAAQQQGRDFRWEGAVAPGKWVKLQNINGGVEVMAASGNSVEVTAVKRGKHGDEDEVRIEVTRYGTNDENVLICAIWNDATCDENGYRSKRRKGATTTTTTPKSSSPCGSRAA